MPVIIHCGDITRLSKAAEFDRTDTTWQLPGASMHMKFKPYRTSFALIGFTALSRVEE
jgi:hypothetical protein